MLSDLSYLSTLKEKPVQHRYYTLIDAPEQRRYVRWRITHTEGVTAMPTTLVAGATGYLGRYMLQNYTTAGTRFAPLFATVAAQPSKVPMVHRALTVLSTTGP